MEDILRDLRRLGRRAAKVGQVFADMRQAAPALSEGADRSGAVTAVVGPDGLPETIRVRSGWRARLPARALGTAVAEACAAAARQRAATWSQSLDALDWPDRLDRGPEMAGPEMAGPKMTVPESRADPLAFPAHVGVPRPIDEIAEDVIRALDEALSAAARMRDAPPRGIGASSGRNLVISLSPDGQVSCEAEPRWVERQTEAALDQALGTALAAARQSLAGLTKGGGTDVATRTNQLMSEILAAAGSARRYPGA